jgi:hypothetical protein
MRKTHPKISEITMRTSKKALRQAQGQSSINNPLRGLLIIDSYVGAALRGALFGACLSALIVVSSCPAAAQPSTNTPPAAAAPPATPVSDTFLGDFESYFTSFGSNTWSGERGFLQTGAAYENQVNFGSQLELGIDVKDLSTNASLFIDTQAINAIGLGNVVSAETGLALGYKIHDVQLIGGLGGGYNWLNKKMQGSAYAELQKKLTSNTHAYIELAPTYVGKKMQNWLMLGAGFEF